MLGNCLVNLDLSTSLRTLVVYVAVVVDINAIHLAGNRFQEG